MTAEQKRDKRAFKTARRLVQRTASTCGLTDAREKDLLRLWVRSGPAQRRELEQFCRERIAATEDTLQRAVAAQSSRLYVGPADVRRVALGDVAAYRPMPTIIS